MAVTGKITIGRGVFGADLCRNATVDFENSRRRFIDAFLTLEQCKIQEGGTIGTFTANFLGAATIEDAQAAYDEMNSVYGNAANADAVKNATQQAANKLR